MKKVFALIAALLIALAAYTIGQRAGYTAGITHAMTDCDAWLDGDEEGLSGWAILELDGEQHKIAIF